MVKPSTTLQGMELNLLKTHGQYLLKMNGVLQTLLHLHLVAAMKIIVHLEVTLPLELT
ncbi:hypothetical protein D9M72_438480 [compost metagenome]